MREIARRVRLTLPGTLVGLATSVSAQDDSPNPVPAPPEPAAIAWVAPVLPSDWDDPQDPASKPKEWRWDAAGLLSVNAVDYGSNNNASNGLQTQTATVIVTARHGDDFLLWIEPDFDGEDTRNNLTEAWGEWGLGPDQWVRVGLIKVALGTEFATRGEDLPLPGYTFPTWLTGRYDWGGSYDAYPGDNSWYLVGATAGEGFDLDGRREESPLLTLRGVLTADQDEQRHFEGLFGGLGIGYGTDGDDEVVVKSPAEQTYLQTSELNGDSQTWIQIEGGGRKGSLRGGFQTGSGTVTGVPVPGGGEADVDELKAWSAFVAWNFTGEAAQWVRGRWAPYTPQDYAAGQPLPIELGLRVGNYDMDRDLFTFGYTSLAESFQEINQGSVALSAYLNPNTRLALEWVRFHAEQHAGLGPPDFDAENDGSTFILRWDQWFGRD